MFCWVYFVDLRFSLDKGPTIMQKFMLQPRIHLFFSLLALFLPLFLFFVNSSVHAKVTGECVNCHTMHNSQNDSPMPGVNNIIEGTTGPFSALTRGSCVGCHSSTSSETVKVMGSSRIPVVYNTVEPVNELAGGNFYWLQKGAEYGHNVLAIPSMPTDPYLSHAPGVPDMAQGSQDCAGCHDRIDNCQSCHNPYHHGDQETPVVGSNVQGAGNSVKAAYYRFLANGSSKHGSGGVMGVEDWDWEQTKTSSDHNVYAGGSIPVGPGSGLDDGSIANYCAGCHTGFHNKDEVLGSGSGSPWRRHPNNFPLPSDVQKEYRLYNTQDGTSVGPYNPEAPIARPDIVSNYGDLTMVRPGTDEVFCLSCHRPHGTPYKDILRWAYSPDDGGTIIAGTIGAGAKKGCFICHTTKDGL